MEEMSRDEMIEKLEALKPEFAKLMRQFGAHEPDWEPLKLVFGGFMFMGYCDGIRMYKHHDTRNYLNLDEHGAAYRWLGEKIGYVQVPIEDAIADAFEGGEMCMGAYRRSRAEPQDAPTFGDVSPSTEVMYNNIHHEEDPDLP